MHDGSLSFCVSRQSKMIQEKFEFKGPMWVHSMSPKKALTSLLQITRNGESNFLNYFT